MAEVGEMEFPPVVIPRDPKAPIYTEAPEGYTFPAVEVRLDKKAKPLASSKPAGSATKKPPKKAELTSAQKAQELQKWLTGYITHIRRPWLVSCERWMYGSSPRYINLWVNPREVSWSLPRRETVTKTAAGVVRNTWRNRYRQTYYDEPTLDITFQAGNIMPSAAMSDANLADLGFTFLEEPFPPRGLQDFYRFLDLLNEPMLLGSSENRHIIVYRSRVFPEMRLEGYFMGSPIAFTDSAANGNTLSWTAKFQVYKSYPTFWHIARTMGAYSDWVRGKAMAEVLPEFPADIPPPAPASPGKAAHAELNPKEKPGAKKLSKKVGIVSGATVKDGKAVQRPEVINPVDWDDPDNPWYNTTVGPQGEFEFPPLDDLGDLPIP